MHILLEIILYIHDLSKTFYIEITSLKKIAHLMNVYLKI